MIETTVELRWWAGCPSHDQAASLVREEMLAAGLDPADLIELEIHDEQEAAAIGFPGSPTILVDGRDVQDPGSGPSGLTCRVYRRRDGRPSPVPDRDDLRDALQTTPTKD